MFSHILTPLDGSPLAACVFPHVVALARATGAQITLLRVLERSRSALEGHVNPFDWQMQKREAQAYLDEMAARLLHTLDLPVKTDLLEGSPAAEIVEYAQRTEADLVVLSSHGQGGLSGWHTSSIAQKVIQRAGTSVLLARAWRPEASCEPAQWGGSTISVFSCRWTVPHAPSVSCRLRQHSRPMPTPSGWCTVSPDQHSSNGCH